MVHDGATHPRATASGPAFQVVTGQTILSLEKEHVIAIGGHPGQTHADRCWETWLDQLEWTQGTWW